MGMMKILFIAWIVLCVIVIIAQIVMDVTKEVDDESSRSLAGTYCVVSSCICSTIIIGMFMVPAILAENALNGPLGHGAMNPNAMRPMAPSAMGSRPY